MVHGGRSAPAQLQGTLISASLRPAERAGTRRIATSAQDAVRPDARCSSTTMAGCSGLRTAPARPPAKRRWAA
eukprot:6556488-Alexandrium_andersonii.AAC.1